ncbi:arsenate reductase (glutaredoxin) [Sulfitobacter sp. F26204]|uniref:arsenate reductase (glutaredoxin) n=1 Tax=Sulfitobacter sp. F26204 TaxID=2996014 RepID=UPI00225E1A5A|nr:arsenate reductase (glutaredoxin) [Sulfitobacter sp. F26204]MCX7558925.1 arsenate reductase (glutaredoxin) [Sulfitobacter sp. F26204]
MITIWHNPRCSKSRQALALIEESGAEVTVRQYLMDAPTAAEITTALSALGDIPAIKMMRSEDKLFKELGFSKDTPDEELIAAMVAHPALIERPIAFSHDRAAIGRPVEAIEELL